MHDCDYVGHGVKLQAFVACDLILYPKRATMNLAGVLLEVLLLKRRPD
jgi:hypothetical protein